MTSEMESYIVDEDNTQFFCDLTYYAIPPNQSKYKIFLMLAFNKKLFRSILCNISIITNESKETFITLFNFLKYKYKYIQKKLQLIFIKLFYYL